MTVYGVDTVEEAAVSAAGGSTQLVLHPGDILTPLARERAKDAGIDIVRAAPGATTPPLTMSGPAVPGSAASGAAAIGSHDPTPMIDLAAAPPARTSPSPALYRRGAPLDPRLGPDSRKDLLASGRPVSKTGRAIRVPRVVVVGAGHVGMIAAMRLAEYDLIDEVVLVDVADGLAEGMALDITHSSALLGFATTLRGERSVEAAGEADYTVITAGRARKPGMTRGDLAATNATIIEAICRSVALTSPTGVVLVVTNPLDEMTERAWRATGFPSSRVIGMAGVLDTARFRSLVALTGLARADEVGGFALGSHGDEMVIPRSLVTLKGESSQVGLDRARLEAIIDRTRDAGAEVVSLLKTGSAFITPGLSAAHMIVSMIRDDGTIVPATVRANGEYGIDGTYAGLPVRLGRNGVRSIVELDLEPDEAAAISLAAARIAERTETLSAPTSIS